MRLWYVAGGARYPEVRLLLENNMLSNERILPWEPFIRNCRCLNVVERRLLAREGPCR